MRAFTAKSISTQNKDMDLLLHYSDHEDDESTESREKSVKNDDEYIVSESEVGEVPNVEYSPLLKKPTSAQSAKLPTVDDLLSIVSSSASSIRPEIARMNDSLILPSLKRHRYDDAKISETIGQQNSSGSAHSTTQKPSDSNSEPKKAVMSRERFLKLQTAATPGASLPPPAPVVGEKVSAKDRVKKQRLQGQSGIGADFRTWRSDEEMRQRQQFDS